MFTLLINRSRVLSANQLNRTDLLMYARLIAGKMKLVTTGLLDFGQSQFEKPTRGETCARGIHKPVLACPSPA